MMTILKKIITNILKQNGYSIQNNTHESLNENNILYPLAENLFNIQGSENFFFIQVGANLGLNGKLNDPLKAFILKNRNVSGVLIEPMIEYLNVVKGVYTENNSLKFENIALGEKDGELKLVRFKPGVSYVKDFYDGLATMKQNRVQLLIERAKKDNTEEFLEEINVPVFTPLYLKSKYNISSVSLLQIDTEGFDYIIVKSFIDNGFTPAIINFEYTELTKTELDSCLKLLKASGYYLVKHGADILAVYKQSGIFPLNDD